MARGLFAVYQDAAPAAVRPTTSSLSAKPRRKALGDGKLKPAADDKWKGKENFDPFGKTELGAGSGLGCGKAKCKQGEKSFLAPPSKPLPSKAASSSSTNGICTGNLRTRVIPAWNDLPLLPPSSGPSSRRQTTERADPPHLLSAASSSSFVAPQVTDLNARSASPAQSFQESLLGTPNSAKDSGYARSVGSESELEVESGDDGEDKTIKLPCLLLSEADKRVRALTESPLAEITQAYTGHGSFNLPPSPNLRTSPTRIRTSLSHSPSKADKRECIKPYEYSTTATTRKVKLAPTSSSQAPAAKVEGLGKAVRSMRV